MAYDSGQISAALGAQGVKSVQTDAVTLRRFSTDFSIYQIPPAAVVTPHDESEVLAVLAAARELGIPITPRGAGSSTAGSALGRGIVLSFGRGTAMNRIRGWEGAAIRVEPGTVHNRVQESMRSEGLFLPADPSSGAFCLIGANVATKASGPHALQNGSIDRYLRHVRFALADGTLIDTRRPETVPGYLHDELLRLRTDLLADRETVDWLAARRGMKTASGYNLGPLLEISDPAAICCQLMAGSVGTLGLITEVGVTGMAYEPERSTTLLAYRSLDRAADTVQALLPLGVAAIEIVSAATLDVVRRKRPDVALPSGSVHLLWVEVTGPDTQGIAERVAATARSMGGLVQEPETVRDPESQIRLWKARKALLPLIRNASPDLKALSVVNDVGVAPEHLGALVADVESIFSRLGMTAFIYGHAGSGNLHLRPLFPIRDPGLPALIKRVADEVYAAVARYNGTITAEHGMGRVRAPYLEGEWGRATVYLKRVKQLFDPEDLLNPGVMFPCGHLTDNLIPPVGVD